MAITKESEIIKLNVVKRYLDEYFDKAVKKADLALDFLESAKSECGTDRLLIAGENTFPAKIEELISEISAIKTEIANLKLAIYNGAGELKNQQQAEYNNYVAEQEKAQATQNGGN